MKKFSLKDISVSSILIALAFICTFIFKFKVGFLTFDLKDAIISIIAFLFGPIMAVISAVIVAVLEFLTVSDTGVYGLIMNAISSSAFAFTIGIFYKYRKSFLNALLGAFTAVFITSAVMMLANIYITPIYMGVPRGEVVKMIPTLLLPFNLIKCTVNAAFTMILYKPITSAFKKVGLIKGGEQAFSFKKFIPILLVSLVIIALAVSFIIFVLKGEISVFF